MRINFALDIKPAITAKKIVISLSLTILLLISILPVSSYGAGNSDLSQTITAGALSTDILDASRVSVASPSVAFGTKSFAFTCQSGGTASTGTLGTASQRLYVSNPQGADNGWTLSVAATSGATSKWANSGVTQTYDFNDSGTSGCSDGADPDSIPGQMTINPSVAASNLDCLTCSATGVSLGSSAAFIQGSVDAITLWNASAGSDNIWRGYLTGIGMSQTIPAEQTADSYTINLTLTATAL